MDNKMEIIKSALDENLEIELEKIPDDRIIEKSHTFSKNFEKKIEEIEDLFRKKQKNIFEKIIINRRWLYIGTPLAAGVILLFTIWWNNGFNNLINTKSGKTEFSHEEQGQIPQGEAIDEAEEEAYMVRENLPSIAESEVAADESETITTETKTTADNITDSEGLNTAAFATSDSAITIQANQIEYTTSDVVILTITNNSDKEVTYSEDISLEILEDGKWRNVSINETICGIELITTIPAGKSSTVEIPLGIFSIDKFDTTYRLSKFIDGEQRYVTIDIVK